MVRLSFPVVSFGLRAGTPLRVEASILEAGRRGVKRAPFSVQGSSAAVRCAHPPARWRRGPVGCRKIG